MMNTIVSYSRQQLWLRWRSLLALCCFAVLASVTLLYPAQAEQTNTGQINIQQPAVSFDSENMPEINVNSWQETNGLRIYHVYLPEIPMIDMALVFAAGSAYDGQQHGIAALTASMLNEGTKNPSFHIDM